MADNISEQLKYELYCLQHSFVEYCCCSCWQSSIVNNFFMKIRVNLFSCLFNLWLLGKTIWLISKATYMTIIYDYKLWLYYVFYYWLKRLYFYIVHYDKWQTGKIYSNRKGILLVPIGISNYIISGRVYTNLNITA